MADRQFSFDRRQKRRENDSRNEVQQKDDDEEIKRAELRPESRADCPSGELFKSAGFDVCSRCILDRLALNFTWPRRRMRTHRASLSHSVSMTDSRYSSTTDSCRAMPAESRLSSIEKIIGGNFMRLFREVAGSGN